VIVVGLTGSVGMGKSTTAQLFVEEGIPVFDADAAVHTLYRGQAVAAIEAAFPDVIAENEIDRERLATRVLGDETAMRRLEAIVHPMVGRMRAAFLGWKREQGHDIVVLDIPLLFETGAASTVDVVVVVSAPEAVQKARVMQRPGMTEARFAAILARQMPDDEKQRRAHFVIETGDGIEAARAQVRDLLRTLRAA
jgi:dephospho-CoA kinase